MLFGKGGIFMTEKEFDKLLVEALEEYIDNEYVEMDDTKVEFSEEHKRKMRDFFDHLK